MSSVVTTTAEPSTADVLARPPRSLWRDAWRRLIANRLARLGMAITLFFLLLAVAIPIVFPYNAKIDSDLANQLLPPSVEHLMGTDEQGRDVMNRIAQGARASLGVGVSSVLIAIIIGSLLGLVSGFLGKRVDLAIMFAMDVMLSFPGLLLAVAVVALLGPGLRNSLLAITIVSIPVYARIARSTVLSVKQLEYINAARAASARRAFGSSSATSCPTASRRSWCRARSASPAPSWRSPRWASWGWANSRPSPNGARCWPTASST